MGTNWQTWELWCACIASHSFLLLEAEPRALHVLDTIPLNYVLSPLSISVPCDITALRDAGIRPGGGWSSCGARQLQAVAGWVFNFAHMFTYVQESSRWTAIYWKVAVTLNKLH